MSEERAQNLPSWRSMHADTDAWAEKIQFDFFRTAPSWRKMEMAGELNSAMIALAVSGIRNRHPEASDDEVRRRLADMLLGPELANRVYGPLQSSR